MERSSSRALKTSLCMSEKKGNPRTKDQCPAREKQVLAGERAGGAGCWEGWEGEGSGHRCSPHYCIVQSGHLCLLDIHPHDRSLERSWSHWKQTPQRSELRPMPRSLVTQPWTLPGGRDINLGAVTTPPHVGSSFLPPPSEHFRQVIYFLSSSLK